MIRKLIFPTVVLHGRGLHRGRWCRVQLFPADAGDGIHFRGRSSTTPARLSSVRPSTRCTTLQGPNGPIHTVEHLLAALHGLGIWDAEIQLQGDEIPVLDGSAAPFVRALMAASRIDQSEPSGWRVARDFSRRTGLASCHLQPLDGCRLECGIWFPHPAIGRQRVAFEGDPHVFATRIAPARTFGMVQDRGYLRSRGLARGATLRNVVVFDETGVLTPGGLRFADEPARHKLLDALGDLALLGGPLKGRVKLERGGHQLLRDTLRAAVREGAILPLQPRTSVAMITAEQSRPSHDVFWKLAHNSDAIRHAPLDPCTASEPGRPPRSNAA